MAIVIIASPLIAWRTIAPRKKGSNAHPSVSARLTSAGRAPTKPRKERGRGEASHVGGRSHQSTDERALARADHRGRLRTERRDRSCDQRRGARGGRGGPRSA